MQCANEVKGCIKNHNSISKPDQRGQKENTVGAQKRETEREYGRRQKKRILRTSIVNVEPTIRL